MMDLSGEKLLNALEAVAHSYLVLKELSSHSVKAIGQVLLARLLQSTSKDGVLAKS